MSKKISYPKQIKELEQKLAKANEDILFLKNQLANGQKEEVAINSLSKSELEIINDFQKSDNYKKTLKEMQEEFYKLGFKHGSASKNPIGTPAAISGHEFFTLNKSLGDNARKINKQILDFHNKSVEKHMKEWSKDSAAALNELFDLAKHIKEK